MRPTMILRAGGEGPIGKYNKFLGGWGNLGSPAKQRGIITFGRSPNAQNPTAGVMHDAIFNTWRRFSSQVLYIAPPFIFFYYAMQWATERNEYLNSKEGRAKYGDAA